MSERLALYFGCWERPGHYLHFPGGRTASYWQPQRDVPGFPTAWNDLMDGGLLQNGKHVDQPDGRVWWTCGGRPDFWFAFFWWDRSIDSRGACNSGLYVRGFEFSRIQEAFDYGCEAFPNIIKRQHFPLALQHDKAMAS